MMIGALKLVAQTVPVRGVVSGVDAKTLPELTDCEDEAPHFKVKAYNSEASWADGIPHQKMIVIDGLLAFKGSANLRTNSWRNASKKVRTEVIEVVTDIEEVINLHNRYFSPVWAKLSKTTRIPMTGFPEQDEWADEED
jgi:phosphatidylserine/phosphatidylglycerophosphate/cardiolipin synthase-like enzyme